MATPVVYANFKLRQLNGNAGDLDAAAAVKVGLITASYTPAAATDTEFSVIDANEVSGTNYTAGGEAVANPSVALDSSTAEWTHDDVTWSQHASGFNDARYAVWYFVATGDLIMYMDLGGNKGNVDGDLTLDVTPATGVLNV